MTKEQKKYYRNKRERLFKKLMRDNRILSVKEFSEIWNEIQNIQNLLRCTK